MSFPVDWEHNGILDRDMGLHGGRADYKHKTRGCIRTTDEAIDYILWWDSFDPVEVLIVDPAAQAT